MKYRLLEKIGSGGMAEVFLAAAEGPEGFERTFVVKRIHAHLAETPEFVRMFVDEAKISALLVHPNIVQVFELACHEGAYYIVMEPVDGIDMARLLRGLERRGVVAPATFVAELGRQACRGLDFAHTLTGAEGRPLGIVHRDVTPPNIMVAWNGTVKILDLGLARAVQELRTNLTEAGTLKGKMSYVAPEQLQGQPADARSDVFSLGVVLHELLSGRRLFVGENDLETLRMVREMPVPRPSLRNPDVKPKLEAVVMRALERDPNKRYRSAAEMGDDLDVVVLRKRYSARAFAADARELAPGREEQTGPIPVGGSQVSVTRPGGSFTRADGLPRRLTPPPLPARAGRGRAAVAAPRSLRARTVWAAAVLPTLASLALLLVLMRGALPPLAPAAAPSPVPAPLPPVAPAAAVAAPSATVDVVVDSRPQGATVSSDGAPLGETPVLVHLQRGDQFVELALAKPGFVPLSFRVVPNGDKEVVATLARGRRSPRVAAVSPRDQSRVLTVTAPLSPAAAPMLTTVRFRNGAGDGFQLIAASFVMDDQPLRVAALPPQAQDMVIYTGLVRPGPHVVSTRLVYQGRNRGPFTYLSGYKLNVESRKVLTVPADRPVSFTITTEKNRGLNLPLSKQLSIVVDDGVARPSSAAVVR
jgi:hypothetical protein